MTDSWQHVANGESNAARSSRHVRTASNLNVNAKATFPVSYSKTLSAPSGLLSKALQLEPRNVPPMLAQQAYMEAYPLVQRIPPSTPISNHTESIIFMDHCLLEMDLQVLHQENTMGSQAMLMAVLRVQRMSWLLLSSIHCRQTIPRVLLNIV